MGPASFKTPGGARVLAFLAFWSWIAVAVAVVVLLLDLADTARQMADTRHIDRLLLDAIAVGVGLSVLSAVAVVVAWA